MDAHNVIAVASISGGKDSLATAIIAVLTHGRENVRLVHADTGHEHPLTQQYVREYLPSVFGMPVDIVQADFSADFERKRNFIKRNWEYMGVPLARVDRALEVLRPTGVPFLDLCMLKGRFPSRKVQFCTEELKRNPLDAYMVALAKETGRPLEGWQGVRRDESMNRRNAAAGEVSDWGWLIRRPIAAWTAAEVIAFATRAGFEQNPLYRQGMGRVGCMTCINVAKDELREVAIRWPAEIDRIREWEAIVGACSKQGFSSLFHRFDWSKTIQTREQVYDAERIDRQVEWAMTSRGGRQTDLERMIPPPACSSVYGLCE